MNNPSRILVDGSKFGLDWLQIYWYGALIVVGIILAYILCSHEAKRRNFHKDCTIDLCLIVVPLGAIFARLYYIVFTLDAFIKPDMSIGEVLLGMINVRDGGLAIYGAIIGGVIGMVIYARVKKMHLLSLFDLVFPSVALAQAIGRWGNFFNQEAYGGVIAEGFPPYFPLAVKIDECTQSCCADMPSRLGNIHYATFFYESCWCLVIFLVLWFILRKRAKHRGDVTLAYLIMYGAERAVIEQFRTDSLMLGPVRVSQALSVLLVVVCVALIIIRAITEKKKGKTVMPVEEVYYGEIKRAEEEEDRASRFKAVKLSDAIAEEEAADKIEEAAEEAAEKAEEAVEEAADKVEEAVEEAAEKAEETTDKVEEAAEKAAEKAEEAVEKAEETVEKEL
ncbi:MAG: prolipoprotein diacylglyceryl transferase [Clostridiales bacterium]|nr:prolipoprotein diacylglyceryl transferase [Clostridiales bacterium]